MPTRAPPSDPPILARALAAGECPGRNRTSARDFGRRLGAGEPHGGAESSYSTRSCDGLGALALFSAGHRSPPLTSEVERVSRRFPQPASRYSRMLRPAVPPGSALAPLRNSGVVRMLEG